MRHFPIVFLRVFFKTKNGKFFRFFSVCWVVGRCCFCVLFVRLCVFAPISGYYFFHTLLNTLLVDVAFSSCVFTVLFAFVIGKWVAVLWLFLCCFVHVVCDAVTCLLLLVICCKFVFRCEYFILSVWRFPCVFFWLVELLWSQAVVLYSLLFSYFVFCSAALPFLLCFCSLSFILRLNLSWVSSFPAFCAFPVLFFFFLPFLSAKLMCCCVYICRFVFGFFLCSLKLWFTVS